jgi:putative SOS response-associated peptidase YedK
MTSRYALYDTVQLEQRFKLSGGLVKGVKPHYNINPTMGASVIVKREGVTVVEVMKWGLIAKGSKDTNSVFRYKTYNVPSEKILTKHSWETAARHNRCLVPVNGFYILTSNEIGKRAYYIERSDKALFALAGIYSSWEDADGKEHGTYSVLAAEANQDVAPVGDRMPLIVHPDDEAAWLDVSANDTNSLYGMIKSFPNGLLHVYEVSPDIHSPKVDKPNLLTPYRY